MDKNKVRRMGWAILGPLDYSASDGLYDHPPPCSQSSPAFLGRTSKLIQDRKQQNTDAVVVYDGDFGLSTRRLLRRSEASSQAPMVGVPEVFHAPLVERPERLRFSLSDFS